MRSHYTVHMNSYVSAVLYNLLRILKIAENLSGYLVGHQSWAFTKDF